MSSLSSEDVSSSEVSEEEFVHYKLNEWIKALNACYDAVTQIKICREHARYLSAIIAANESPMNVSDEEDEGRKKKNG